MLLDRKRVNFWVKTIAIVVALSFAAAFVVQFGGGMMTSTNTRNYERTDSVGLLQQNVKSDPKDINSVLKLAAYFQKKDNQKAAEKLYLNSLKSNPGNAKLETAIGGLYLISQKPDKAVTHFLKAVNKEPSSALAYLGLAYSYEMFGKKDLARNNLETFLKNNPTSSYAETVKKEIKRLTD